jgi:hypothetical protein
MHKHLAKLCHLALAGYRLPMRTVLLAPLQNRHVGGCTHAGAYRRHAASFPSLLLTAATHA